MTTCKSCGRPIFWAQSETSGKMMPVDAEPHVDGNLEITRWRRRTTARVVTPNPKFELYMSHFATCTNPQQHRRPR